MKTNISMLILGSVLLTNAVLTQDLQHVPAFPDAPSRIRSDGALTFPDQRLVFYQSPASIPVPESADRLVLAGRANTPGWSLEISRKTKDGEWTDWLPVEIHRHPAGRFWAITPTDNAIALRYRLRQEDPTTMIELQFYAVEFAASVLPTEQVSQRVSIQIRPTSDTIPAPPIVSRAAWGARLPNGILVPHLPYRSTIHHTAMSRVTSLEEGIAEMQFIQDLHMDGNGWADIGYHYCIDDSGRIYEGTEVQYRASHTDNNNTGNVGIAFLGSFSSVAPTQKAWKACASLLGYLVSRYPIRIDSIFGHRDFAPTTVCPGDAAYSLLPALRDSIRCLLAAGAPYVKNPLPLPFSTNVDPASQITLRVRDDVEGVRTDSVQLSVNGASVSPTIQALDAHEIEVTYNPAAPFHYSSLVSVDLKAQDKSTSPNRLVYHFEFRIKPKTVFSEMTSENGLSNGTLTKTGLWTTSTADATLPDLTDGVMISARDSMQDHHINVHPDITESGNYIVSIVLPISAVGFNARYVLTNSHGVGKEEFVEYNKNFELAWYPLGTSALYFSAGSPSNGSIELRPLPGFTTMMMLDAIKFERKNDLAPPAVPEMKSVRLNAEGNISVEWYPSLEGGLLGYRLLSSTDGSTWTDTIADEQMLGGEDSSFVVPAPTGIGIQYFRIVAVDTVLAEGADGEIGHQLSEPSDAYGVAFGLTRRILVVDAFDRIGSWPNKQHSFIRNYGNALSTLHGGWETAVNDAIQSGEIQLNEYGVVIYMCGDDSDRDESLSNIELLRLKEYLDGGGFLFISGSEIAYDLGRPGRPDGQLFTSVLKSTYGGDDAGVRSCGGLPGTSFSGLTLDFGVITDDTYQEEFPDYVTPSGGSTPLIGYQGTSRTAAIGYIGAFGTDTTRIGRLVYFAFPFETIYPAQSRSDVMTDVFDYLAPMGVAADNSITPTEFELRQNFPNPFNPSTTIRFFLPMRSRSRIVVFNLLGQPVGELSNGVLQPGWHEARWTANVATGIYFYRLEAASIDHPSRTFSETKKMLLER